MAKLGSGVVYVGDNNEEHAALVVGNRENGNQDLAVWVNGAFHGRDNVPRNEERDGDRGHTWRQA